jgi:Zn finger protein HypA/HybF involved in hydrogenase expression
MTTGPVLYLCRDCVPTHKRHAFLPPYGRLRRMRILTEAPVEGCAPCHDEALMLAEERQVSIESGAATICPTCHGTGLVRPDD